ncbi:MAG: biotin synthase BioB [Nitrososphaerales archaeon]
MKKVLSGKKITMLEAENLLNIDSKYILELTKAANAICREMNGDNVDVESLINAKAGNCSEDCAFCAQSAHYKTDITKYQFLDKETILGAAARAKKSGAGSFCLVCAWREPTEQNFEDVCDVIKAIKKDVDIDVNCSLGFLTEERAKRLKELGVKRYNHNLEASKSFFDQICSTHSYNDRINTAKIVKSSGLQLCCGGILGMGETRAQRLELAFEASELEPDEFPVNILIPRPGTPLAGMKPLDPMELIKTIAVYRFILPRSIIKIAGGREVYLGNLQALALLGGANGIITGGYLTVGGNEPEKDIRMIKELGLKA